MIYDKKIVVKPKWLKRGVTVGVVGEGEDVFKVEEIIYKENVIDWIRLNYEDGSPYPFREPLSKIYRLKNGLSSINDPSCFIEVYTGECDECNKKFSDSFVSYRSHDKIFCQGCKDAYQKSVLIG